jgi:hypothetical protein
MECPFPGMDPYLEHPALWPDPHKSLIVAIADAISPRIVPRYYAALGHRAYEITNDPADLFGRPLPDPTAPALAAARDPSICVVDQVDESFVEIRQVGTDRLVTVIEILSYPTKLDAEGRRYYEAKRDQILDSETSLVEIDLLRDGEPMGFVGEERTDYGILISRAWQRPRAKLYAFGVHTAIPTFPLPLLQGEDEVPVDLNAIFHTLYDRVRYDLRLDYSGPAVPPLSEANAAWARGLIGG